MNTNRILKRLGAISLATATILTGLCVGTAAAQADEPDGNRATVDFVGITTVVPGRPAIISVGTPRSGKQVTYNQYDISNPLEAGSDADEWSFPVIGASGQVRATGSAEGLCLTASGVAKNSRLLAKPCSTRGAKNQNFRWAYVGGGLSLSPASAPTTFVATSPRQALVLGSRANAVRLQPIYGE
ncbi:hypothetical protein [Frigoribacterium sp. VKM Ac-2836]|uniref:hypothetical protein n=1 Tax=Frigoribacterium sp. VKM Ac-2836 TaxID=2739014 RepID=UPI001566EEBA|nr:hypothetical protein [Frigoribacterium sp. VKM Ac-2836]NRD25519.1 hypothetical protein [Frigoribacterium sp. VKM Ac-2836]